MVANRPQQVATVDELGQPLRAHDDAFGSAMLQRFGQMICGIQGHEHLVQFSEERIFLRCITCGHESPGWEVPTRLKPARASTPRARVVPSLPTERVA
ncbi:MAG: hypothetical protein AB7N65_28575 [Vicinamibacterales bacterium]